MKHTLGLLVLLAGCAGSPAAPAEPANPPSQTATPPATPPAAPPPISGTATGVQTGVGDPDAPALEVSVSFSNEGSDTCKVTGYALAWDRSAEAVRQPCTAEVTVGPSGTATATCLVPFDSAMRNAQPAYADRMEVVDIAATCQAAP